MVGQNELNVSDNTLESVITDLKSMKRKKECFSKNINDYCDDDIVQSPRSLLDNINNPTRFKADME